MRRLGWVAAAGFDSLNAAAPGKSFPPPVAEKMALPISEAFALCSPPEVIFLDVAPVDPALSLSAQSFFPF
jgi:hypothetical protein